MNAARSFAIRVCRFGSRWNQIGDKLLQVAFVVAQRVNADVAFVAQVIEKLSELVGKHANKTKTSFVMVNRVNTDKHRFFALKSFLYRAS